MSYYARADIENPEAYQRAIEARIKQNASITRGRKFDAAYPGLRARIYENARVVPQWLRDALLDWNGLTEKQAAVALDILDRSFDKAWDEAHEEQARRANTPPWTPGRQIVTGQIVSTKIIEGDWGAQYKGLIVTPEQRKLWVTLPNFLFASDVTVKNLKGALVTINVTVQPKDSDPTFAFGSRPTKPPQRKP